MQNINTLYSKFFNEKNFKNIDLPFISKQKKIEFQKVTDPKGYENFRRKRSLRNLRYRQKKDYAPNLVTKSKMINRVIQGIQTTLLNAINELKKTSGVNDV